ncbi:MAG TPA: phosphate signaling complex protein PhoU [Actinomycetota bacterium]|nr:phosphate signaling complex protein PhoU [Actinomycetota bacterium]
MLREPRRHFHEQLQDLERAVQDMGVAARDLFDLAMQALVGHDLAVCAQVIAGDDTVDAYYLRIERHIMDLFALQTPVASDLRLLTALLHINLHLERVADMPVNIAKIVNASGDLPSNAIVLERLEEMGEVALQMLAAVMDAFERRDLELCYRLTSMDDTIDRLNRGMLPEVLDASPNKALLEWGIGMHVVSREIERVGDHAVDIGEQVAFIITGEFMEFTDASHPEREARIAGNTA